MLVDPKLIALFAARLLKYSRRAGYFPGKYEVLRATNLNSTALLVLVI